VYRIFRNTNPFAVLLLFVFAFLLFVLPTTAPLVKKLEIVHNSVLYSYVLEFFNWLFGSNKGALIFLSLCLTLFQALYLNYLSVRNKLFHQTGYLPALLFVFLSAISSSFRAFTATQLAVCFLLPAMNLIFSIGSSQSPRKHLFNIGFLFSLIALIIQPAYMFFVLMYLCIAFLRPIYLVEWVVLLLGFLTPIYFFTTILYLFDFTSWIELIGKLQLLPFKDFHLPVQNLIYSVFFVVLLITGIYLLQSQLTLLTIYVRRCWAIIFGMLVFSSIVALFMHQDQSGNWLLVVPASTLLISNIFTSDKRKQFVTFAFYFVFATLIIFRYFL
jgi:hypothetical protein